MTSQPATPDRSGAVSLTGAQPRTDALPVPLRDPAGVGADGSAAGADLPLIVVDGGTDQACSIDGVCGPAVPADIGQGGGW